MKPIITTILAVILVAGAQAKDESERMFKVAQNAELVDGNLKAAIEQYKKIVAHHGGNRAAAAKALVQMGRCYEKLGKAEARKAYQRVVTEYADQGEPAAQASLRLAALTKPVRPTVAGMQIRRVWRGPDDMLSKSHDGDVCADGRYLTFYERRGRSLMVLDLATGESRRLVQGGSPEHQPHRSRVSADCTQIAYEWDGPGGDEELRLIGIDGSGERVLYRNQEVPHIHPRGWLPDGKHIVVATTLKDRTSQIAVVSVADGSLRVLKSFDWKAFPYSPTSTVSPDGRYVAYELADEDLSGHDIALLATDGSRETPLVTHPADDDVVGWAPDGRTLLFLSDRTGRDGLWAIPVSDGKAQGAPQLIKKDIGRIDPWGVTQKGTLYYAKSDDMHDVYVATLDPATGKILDRPRPATESVVGNTLSPAWSPDGKYLAYYTLSGSRGYGNMVIRSLETGEERTLSPKISASRNSGAALQWCPDGRSILRPGWIKGEHGLYLVDVRTGGVTSLVRMPDQVYVAGAVWAPDGKSIYYPRGDLRAKKGSIARRDLETSRETILYEENGLIQLDLAISPDGRHLAFASPVILEKGAKALRIIATTGGEPREVVRLGPQELPISAPPTLAWTPDGRYLLYLTGDGTGKKSELWRVAIEGGRPEKLDLTMEGLGELRVHPDGRRIAFSASQEVDEIWVLENFLPELRAAK